MQAKNVLGGNSTGGIPAPTYQEIGFQHIQWVLEDRSLPDSTWFNHSTSDLIFLIGLKSSNLDLKSSKHGTDLEMRGIRQAT